MDQPNQSTAKTTISPEVLLTIARLSALSVAGVVRLSSAPTDMNQLLGRTPNEGVRINVVNGVVYADIYVVLTGERNVREVAREMQAKITRAISEMVGMEVGKINIHVEDIDYTTVSES